MLSADSLFALKSLLHKALVLGAMDLLLFILFILLLVKFL